MVPSHSPNPAHLDVIAIGNAIVDILCFADDDLLLRHSLKKTEMRLCSREEQDELLSDTSPDTSASGGSAANTITSLSGLGAHCGFMGTVARDQWGTFFQADLEKSGVMSLIETIDDIELSTGTSVILITPDSERTMNTHLGAAGHISDSTIRPDIVATADVVYIEGYAYDREIEKQAVINAMNIAHTAGNKVALTLSDASCVDRHHADFIELVSRVDILFANESELCRLFDIDEQVVTPELLTTHARHCAPITVVTQSERGCTVMDNSQIISVPGLEPHQLVDLTGAGDQFAAGFLYGLGKKYSISDCARLGIELATRVISRVGPRIDTDELAEISSNFIRN